MIGQRGRTTRQSEKLRQCPFLWSDHLKSFGGNSHIWHTTQTLLTLWILLNKVVEITTKKLSLRVFVGFWVHDIYIYQSLCCCIYERLKKVVWSLLWLIKWFMWCHSRFEDYKFGKWEKSVDVALERSDLCCTLIISARGYISRCKHNKTKSLRELLAVEVHCGWGKLHILTRRMCGIYIYKKSLVWPEASQID